VIDTDIFTAEMELLAERFNRQVSDPVFARYYDLISAHLTTAEFQQAAIAIFNEDRFFPAPADFVHRVHGDVESQAEREWAELLRAIKAGERSNITDVGRKALAAVGGTWAIENCDSDKDLGFKRREFVKAYKDIKNPPLALRNGQQALPPSNEQAKALVGRLFSEAAND
jgi:hypothetical protein